MTFRYITSGKDPSEWKAKEGRTAERRQGTPAAASTAERATAQAQGTAGARWFIRRGLRLAAGELMLIRVVGVVGVVREVRGVRQVRGVEWLW